MTRKDAHTEMVHDLERLKNGMKDAWLREGLPEK